MAGKVTVEADHAAGDQVRADPITRQQAVRLIESFRRFPVQDVTGAILMAALATRQRFQLSYWDSAILEASRAMGCAEVLSEDLGDGQDYAGIRVTNHVGDENRSPAFSRWRHIRRHGRLTSPVG
jgi:hypothetical protein